MTAHDALQGGELDDRVGDEVGLAQQRGAHDVIAPGARDAGGVADGLGVLHDAHGLVVDASELLLEHDALQAIDVAFERLAAILDHEEGRIVETGAHDALVTCDDGLGVGGITVAHDEKRVVERAIGLVHREVALMLEHRVGDDLGRDVKETLVEVREHDGGIFNEVHDLVEGALGSVGLEARLGLDGVDLTANGLRTLLRAGNNLHLLVGGRQVGGIRKLEFAVGHEAVAARDAARNQTGILDGHDFVAIQGHEPAHGTREGDMTGCPNAATWAADACNEAGKQVGQDIPPSCGRLLDQGVHIFLAALVRLAHETGDVNALATAKPSAAFVGLPSSSKAIAAAGPLAHMESASLASARSSTTRIMRRGVE